MIKTRMTALAVKTFRSLEDTQCFIRISCWIMRSFKNDRAQIQFWINCWLQSRLTHKHGWRLTNNGWTLVPIENRGSGRAVLCDIPKAVSSLWYHCMRQKHGWQISVELPNSCSHREQGLWRGPFCVTYQSSELYIKALQEAESGLKQWALYHYIAGLSDGTADADGWLEMTVQWWWFQAHCSEISGGRSLKRLFLYLSAAVVSCLPDLRCQFFVQSPTSPGEKRDAL